MPTDFGLVPGEPNAKLPSIYRFGDFEIDIAEDVLRKNGEKVSLNRRAFGVLRVLVERAGTVVSKQEFFDTVWADTFVEDNSLTVAMTTLRKVLGDDAKNPRFIENLPRKGYRFIGEVTIIDEPSVFKPRKSEGVVVAKRPGNNTGSELGKRKVLVGILTACLLVAIFGLGFTYLSSSTGGSAASRSSLQIDSIGVLPFVNENAATEYLSDGFTESIINSLAEIPNLRIISRNSVFQYKGKQTDLQKIGRELNVRAVLTGRFVVSGDSLVVNAELIDLGDNRQIWGRQFNRNMTDTFVLQQEISQEIVKTLRLKLKSEDPAQLASRATSSPEAFQLYLKGRYQWNKRAGTEEAIDFFKQAIEKDPAYAQPYVGLANCYLWFNFEYPVSMDERSSMVKAAAQKALEIDPQLGEVYATLAINSHFNEWNWPAAEQYYKRAIELSPGYATAHHWYAEFLATTGRFDESFAAYKRALEIDPLSLAIKTDLGLNYYYARQSQRSIEYLKTVYEIDPNYGRTPLFLATVYELEGMYAEAIDEGDRAYAHDGDYLVSWPERSKTLRKGFETNGSQGYWQVALEFELRQKIQNPYQIVKCYGRLGDLDKAFENMDKLYAVKSPLLVWLKVSPEFDVFRADPRFDYMLGRVGLP